MRHHYETQPDAEVLLTAVGRLWLCGKEPRWEALHTPGSRQRIPLPTYPFERAIHWLTTPENAPRLADPPPSTSGISSCMDDWFHVPSWERTPPLAQSRPAPDAADTLWIIFADNADAGAGIRSQIPSSRDNVICVRRGKQFAKLSPDSFTINPANSDDSVQLLREFKGGAWKQFHIIHLFSSAVESGVNTPDIGTDLTTGFFGLLHLAQAISRLGISIPIVLCVVSHGIHDVTGTERLRPRMASVLGPCLVIPKEIPNVACFNVDLQDDSNSSPDWARIVAEFSGPECGAVVAFRGPHRWLRKFTAISLPAITPGQPAPLSNSGAWIITGGTGGLGMAIAAHLAKSRRAPLILTRRTPFPARENWPALATAKPASPDANLIAQFIELERLGSTVEVMSADVSDELQMERIFTAARERHGAIQCVIHAAGIIRDGLLEAKRDEDALAVIIPKLPGTELLHRLAAQAGAELLVLFSSTASVLGPAGQIDYTAANACMDAFSHFANRQPAGPRTIAINWPGWRETGILAAMEPSPEMKEWKDAAMQMALSTADGVEIFERAIQARHAQLIVSMEPPGTRPSANVTARGSGISGPRQPAPVTAPAPSGDEGLEDFIAWTWADVLGFDEIGRDQDFFAAGGHSLSAMQVVARLRTGYQVDLSLREFFETRTIASLAALIEAKILSEIDSMNDEEVRALISKEEQRNG